MEPTKRLQIDITHNCNINKKQKLGKEITTINSTKSVFEYLANETIYQIFEYLDTYHVYYGFFDLNKRFKTLYLRSNFPPQINISTMSKTNFECYYKKIILPNIHQINYLRLSNPFTVDIVFSPPNLISKFLELKTLVLDNINYKSFKNLLKFLPKLHSLTINFDEYIEDPSILFGKLFNLSKLKYCSITYQGKYDFEPKPINFSEYDRSHIENLVINTRFPFESFNNLLSCLPRLRHLSIDCLVNSCYMGIEEEEEERPVESKYLKSVLLKLDSIDFDRFEDLIKNYFQCVEVLRLTTECDLDYVDANLWEKLIVSYMPNLRQFDIHHRYTIYDNNPSILYEVINEFMSSFWIEKNWFFTHQNTLEENSNNGIFYSTNPYRRKDYTINRDFNQTISRHLRETFNSVKHVRIHTQQTTANCVKYFPNATELTMNYYSKTIDHSIEKTLNHIIPLKKLTKLVIRCFIFPFEQIIKLICYTPNLHTLKIDILPFVEINPNLIQQSRTVQYVSKTNKIKHLDLRAECTLEKTKFIVHLFPKLEYLKIGLKKKERNQIVRFLLSKTNPTTCDLFFLCMSEIPKRYLKDLNMLIKLENLLDDYYMKFVNRDLHLWW